MAVPAKKWNFSPIRKEYIKTRLDKALEEGIQLPEEAAPRMSHRSIRLSALLILSTLVICGAFAYGNVNSDDYSGICFSPYIDGQNPDVGTYIPEAQIEERIKIIAPYTGWIRTFGSSSGLEKTGKIARKYNLKVAAGAWIGNNTTVNEQELQKLRDVASAGEADILIIGSEALLRGNVTEVQLINYINDIRSDFPNLPVTTVDTYDQWQKHPLLVDAVDVICVNIYPYWEGIDISTADTFTVQKYSDIVNISEGKQVIISELGWPSAGEVNIQAVPSPTNAALYIKKMKSWALNNNIQYFWFEAFDENWKKTNEGEVGAHWGIWGTTGNLKYLISDQYFMIFRPSEWNNWVFSNNMTRVVLRNHYGDNSDKPLSGDFNNDGVADRAVFQGGEWIIDYNMDGSTDLRNRYGKAGDIPITGRMNTDGIADRAVFRNGQWIIDHNMDGTINVRNNFGTTGDIPLIGDFNNDGVPDRVVFRNGQWIIDYNMDGSVNARNRYGQMTDIPLVGDFNADGITDRAVFRSGEWIIDYTMDGSVNTRLKFGMTGDVPMVWNL